MTSQVRAQSLGDAARQEEERRQKTKPATRVITNKDLSPAPGPSTMPVSSGSAGSPASSTGGTTASAADTTASQASKSDADKTDAATDGAKDQKFWSGRMKGLQEQLQRDRGYAEALQSRINALTTDFTNRDDPYQRAGIGRDRQKAVDELDRLKKAVADGSKAIAALEEEARRAGVPAGWLR